MKRFYMQLSEITIIQRVCVFFVFIFYISVGVIVAPAAAIILLEGISGIIKILRRLFSFTAMQLQPTTQWWAGHHLGIISWAVVLLCSTRSVVVLQPGTGSSCCKSLHRGGRGQAYKTLKHTQCS